LRASAAQGVLKALDDAVSDDPGSGPECGSSRRCELPAAIDVPPGMKTYDSPMPIVAKMERVPLRKV
jgi:hypothetical protein